MRYRVAAAIALVALAAGTIALVSGTAKVGPLPARGQEQLGLAFLKRDVDAFAVKVNGKGLKLNGKGVKGESPVSYADQMAQLNAYPEAGISADEITAAQNAGLALNHRGYGQGKHSTTAWYPLGPTSGIYPGITNRSGSQYAASGRITALAIKPGCGNAHCTVWVASAGGGVWRTDKGIGANPKWVNVSDGSFTTGAIGALTYDAASGTLYAGTGEDAAAGDAEAGQGIWKSTDDGTTWTPLAGNSVFVNRSVRQIAVSGSTIYVADGRGVHGISATEAGQVSNIPTNPQGVGVWKSTDGGNTFTLLQSSLVTSTAGGNVVTFPSSFGSLRGATDVVLDPTHAGVVYATAYNEGVWRSNDGGATWTQIKTAPNTGAWRDEIAVAAMPNGDTRMYVGEGDSGPPTDSAGNITHGDVNYSRFSVANGVQSGAPVFDDKTTDGLVFDQVDPDHKVADPSSPGYATYNFCTGQCWYDMQVVSPPENPNIVYLLGSYTYGEDLGSGGNGLSNARAVLLSRDGGNTFTDVTADGTSPTTPNMLHPDEHYLITVPGKPLQFFEGSDGGLMRSDGTLVDTSSRCDSRSQLSRSEVAVCKQLLSAVPGSYTSMNDGLATMQFMQLSVNPTDKTDVQGGTQDNGTFESYGSVKSWPQTVGGDGGMSGFDAANPKFRFHTYYYQQVDSSFGSGDPRSWDWISDPLFNGEYQLSLFYMPTISDPVVSGSMFAGITYIWRTQDNGGSPAFLDQHCSQFRGGDLIGTGCGDWTPIGGAQYGDDNDPFASPTFAPGTRQGGVMSWVQRSTTDSGTLWGSTTLGRLYISHNANAANPNDVVLTRIDNLPGGSALPRRAISSIYVDPANPNHAWVSYLGYNQATPAQPGHVFSVTYDPLAGSVSVTSIDNDLGNQPVNSIVENTNGDLYVGTDFGVAELANGTTSWVPAADGLPIVTVASLTINPAAHQLLAATHGRGAYQLTLP